ncbi:MAG TPA: hypothetical protein VMZ69_01590, partial [Saprospiraceae bacterium]|nr:hypothetical protein [Saprospiraceae bacterium]
FSLRKQFERMKVMKELYRPMLMANIIEATIRMRRSRFKMKANHFNRAGLSFLLKLIMLNIMPAIRKR